jgi:hypothetical protein
MNTDDGAQGKLPIGVNLVLKLVRLPALFAATDCGLALLCRSSHSLHSSVAPWLKDKTGPSKADCVLLYPK